MVSLSIRCATFQEFIFQQDLRIFSYQSLNLVVETMTRDTSFPQ